MTDLVRTDDPNIDENDMDPMKWANRVTKKRADRKEEPEGEREIDPESGLPKAKVHAHRTLKPDDLSYDFLAKMGFVPPPPPPPWGFNKDGKDTSEIEERVMRCVILHSTVDDCCVARTCTSALLRASLRRQLIPISDLPTTMMCESCNLQSRRLLLVVASRYRAQAGCRPFAHALSA